MLVRTGKRASKLFLRSHVGNGSKAHDFDADLVMTRLTSAADDGVKVPREPCAVLMSVAAWL